MVRYQKKGWHKQRLAGVYRLNAGSSQIAFQKIVKRFVYRRYVDEQEIEEISLKQAMLLLRENYRDVDERELMEMLKSFLQTPGALYSH